MGQIIWKPDPDQVPKAGISRFTAFVEQRHGLRLPTYSDLHSWSIDRLGDFWQAVWDYFDVHSTTSPGPVVTEHGMPHASWFNDSRINYAQHALRHDDPDAIAIVSAAEPPGDVELVTWRELRRQVAALAHTLRANGIGPGDTVVGYLPNIAEAVVSFLATASIGAIWSCCGQDYALPATLARFRQLNPVALITCDGYRFNGKIHRKTQDAAKLWSSLPDVRIAIAVDRVGIGLEGMIPWTAATTGDYELDAIALPFDHPLWVVFSSGSTGVPKGIVHGHGGVLIEQLKTSALHFDLNSSDTFFWFTTPSWMVWNSLVGGLLLGTTIVCYDGSPTYPEPPSLWNMVDQFGVTMFGTSPSYLLGCRKDGRRLRGARSLETLRCVGVTGSPLPASTAEWLVAELGPRVRVSSTSGGTDVVTGFVGGAPTIPVRDDEIPGPCLAVAVESFDADGNSLIGEVGELVITKPMPSMPLRFWNDAGDERYRDAYFSLYPGVWRQGDWITITDSGGIVMHGRSDATLNRHGVRIGSADIYAIVERISEIAEALVLGVDEPDGGYWMPLFVVPKAGVALDDNLRSRIVTAIRADASPRHVPDDIIEAPRVPHTLTGKKLEVPLIRLMQGASPAAVLDPAAVDVPEVIEWYASIARQRLATHGSRATSAASEVDSSIRRG